MTLKLRTKENREIKIEVKIKTMVVRYKNKMMESSLAPTNKKKDKPACLCCGKPESRLDCCPVRENTPKAQWHTP